MGGYGQPFSGPDNRPRKWLPVAFLARVNVSEKRQKRADELYGAKVCVGYFTIHILYNIKIVIIFVKDYRP
jgi:hypothetical protein